MSAEQNLETARQMYQAFGLGDVQAILDLVTDDAGGVVVNAVHLGVGAEAVRSSVLLAVSRLTSSPMGERRHRPHDPLQ